jgi:SH3 domain protein
MKKFFLACIALVVCVSVFADTRYVAGPAEALLRAGPSEYADVSSKLVKDSKVDVIGVDRSTDYALVVTPDKKRGWVPSSALTATPPAMPVLSQPAGADVAPAVASSDTPATNQNTPAAQKATADQAAVVADTAPAPAATMDPSKSYYGDVKEKLNALASANAATPNTIVKLSTQEMLNYTAIQRENRAWFISGASILILGMIIGLIISRIAFKRRRSTWD